MTSDMIRLMLGTAKVDITPERPVPLAGFARRKGVFEAVERPLYARVWFFEQQAGDGKREKALLIQADLIWWGSDQVQRIVKELKEKWDLDEASVILHATHNHSGPQTSHRFTPSLGIPDRKYLLKMKSLILAAVATAHAGLEPVTIEKGVGECRIGINRRKIVAGEVITAPNSDGPLDSEITVIRFRSRLNTLKGVMFHYTCHPTIVGENKITSEFPGVAMENVEQVLGDGVVASYLQGCCGDIRPTLIRDDAFYLGNMSDVSDLGTRLSDEVLSVLEKSMDLLSPAVFAARRLSVNLPFQRLPAIDELYTASEKEGVLGEWGRLLQADPVRIQSSIPMEVGVIHIAQGLSFLTMNAEVVVEYGLFIKELSSNTVLPIPYSNGMIGYVPTAKQLFEGGYEPDNSTLYFGLPSRFDVQLESMIHTAFIELIGKNNTLGKDGGKKSEMTSGEGF
jgi:hypothetical protein